MSCAPHPSTHLQVLQSLPESGLYTLRAVLGVPGREEEREGHQEVHMSVVEAGYMGTAGGSPAAGGLERGVHYTMSIACGTLLILTKAWR